MYTSTGAISAWNLECMPILLHTHIYYICLHGHNATCTWSPSFRFAFRSPILTEFAWTADGRVWRVCVFQSYWMILRNHAWKTWFPWSSSQDSSALRSFPIQKLRRSQKKWTLTQRPRHGVWNFWFEWAVCSLTPLYQENHWKVHSLLPQNNPHFSRGEIVFNKIGFLICFTCSPSERQRFHGLT